jgi:hypothetical protein
MEKKLVIEKAIAAIKSAADAFTASVGKATSTITSVVVKHIKELKAAKATNKEIHATVHAAIGDACTPQNINKILLANDVRLRAERSDKKKTDDKSDKDDKADKADKSKKGKGITETQIAPLLVNATADVQRAFFSNPEVVAVLQRIAAEDAAAAETATQKKVAASGWACPAKKTKKQAAKKHAA